MKFYKSFLTAAVALLIVSAPAGAGGDGTGREKARREQ